MNIITIQELTDKISNITRSTVVSLTYVVDDSRSKTIVGKKQIQKKVKISHLYLNHDYQNKVRKLTDDSSFQAFEMKGKTRICGTLVQSDKTQELLLDGKILKSCNVEVQELYYQGQVISEKEAENLNLWVPAYYKESEVSTSGRGLVSEEDDFKMITLGLNKILNIKISGVLYTIEK